MIRDCSREVRKEGLRGGEGTAWVRALISGGERLEGVSFVAFVRLEPGASLGYHDHIDEGEIYYILEGAGDFYTSPTDSIPVKAGDMTYLHKDQGHSITNTSDDDLLMLAIVYEDIVIDQD